MQRTTHKQLKCKKENNIYLNNNDWSCICSSRKALNNGYQHTTNAPNLNFTYHDSILKINSKQNPKYKALTLNV